MQYDAHLTVSSTDGPPPTTWAKWDDTDSAVTASSDVIVLLGQDVLVIKIWGNVGPGNPVLSGLVLFSDSERKIQVGSWNPSIGWTPPGVPGVAATYDQKTGYIWIGHDAQPFNGTYYLTVHGNTTIGEIPYSWAIDPELTLQSGGGSEAEQVGRQLSALVGRLVDKRLRALGMLKITSGKEAPCEMRSPPVKR